MYGEMGMTYSILREGPDEQTHSMSTITGAVEPSHHTSTSALNRRIASLIVWGTWSTMLVVALFFIGQYGSNVPSWDDWDMVPALTGAQPITASWLWSQHNEHRVPLPRLLLLGLHRITGINFRTPMFFSVFALGALAFAMIRVASRLRGWITYSDAFFPLVLLHWGQAPTLLWGWQLQFISSTVLVGIVLLVMVQCGREFRLGPALVAGGCILLLPFCGANGLALVPVLALWMICWAVLRWRSRERHARRHAILMLALAFSALLFMGLYLVGYERVPNYPTYGSRRAIAITAIEFLTTGLGPATSLFPTLSSGGALCLLVLSGAALVVAWIKKPQEPQRPLALLSFLGAMASLALSLGLGMRNGFEMRYVILAAPVWCCVYFIWSMCGTPRIASLARMFLLIAACLTLWPNAEFGMAYARSLRHELESFEHDMDTGMPTVFLIRRHWPEGYLHMNQDILTDYLPMLQRAGVGKFRSVQENPPMREVSVPLQPVSLNAVTWERGIAHGTGGKDPYLVFALSEERYVYGLRFKYSYSNEAHTAPCRFVYWRRGDQDGFPENQGSNSCPTGDRANWSRGTWVKAKDSESFSSMTVWICDAIKDIKIYPDFKTMTWFTSTPQPFTFEMSELVLLVPANQ